MGDSRALGEQERLLHYLHPYGGLMPLQVMHIRGPLDVDLVADALRWLQRQHPMLRAHIRYGELVFRSRPPFVYRQPYFDTEGTTEIPLQTVGGRWEDALTEELRKPLRRGNNPRLRVTFVREDAKDLNHLIFCADHATLDAQAAHMMCRQLLEYFADPAVMVSRAPVHDRLPPPSRPGSPPSQAAAPSDTSRPCGCRASMCPAPSVQPASSCASWTPPPRTPSRRQ